MVLLVHCLLRVYRAQREHWALMKCLQCQTYICDIILLVESGIIGVTDKQWKLSHHHHFPKHTMVVGGVVNAVNENNMASSNNEALPINTWLI